ncbi:hypothetical protein F383_17672 [Gossypium arboreum]|uniref:Uncharacterized protein n=1 Tax=Gossypium arboreum TaxID=29729 RepID=A0A0B0MFK4_GOSAR|nr:hypothetical protein F383_17672 [Gossypium arboreum]
MCDTRSGDTALCPLVFNWKSSQYAPHGPAHGHVTWPFGTA